MSAQFYPKHQRPWSWLSLLFSSFYFISFLYMPLSIGFVIQSTVFYGVFVALYMALLNVDIKWRLSIVLTTICLGFLASSVNPSASMILGYASFYAGYYFSRKKALVLSLSTIASLFGAAWAFDLMNAYYIMPGLIPIVALVIMGSYIQMEERHRWREKQSDEEKKQLAKTAERERIARDLHDTLGHTLSSITLKSQLAKKLGHAGDMEAALKEIAEVESISREALSDVRSVVSNYKPLNLKSNIQKLRSRLEDAAFSVDVSISDISLKPEVESAIVLIAKEAVTNILRHSNGSKVKIDLFLNQPDLILSVKDNGSISTLKKGNGLHGIEERVNELNGRACVSIENGVSIICKIPEAAYEHIDR